MRMIIMNKHRLEKAIIYVKKMYLAIKLTLTSDKN